MGGDRILSAVYASFFNQMFYVISLINFWGEGVASGWVRPFFVRITSW